MQVFAGPTRRAVFTALADVRADARQLSAPAVWAFFSLANVAAYREYQLATVLVFTATAGWLAAVMVRAPDPVDLPRFPWVLSLGLLAVGSVLVFQPTYLPPEDALRMRMAILLCTFVLGTVWLIWPSSFRASLLASTAALGATAWVPITGIPVPGNDVWFLLQQSNEGLVRGENMYRMSWTGVPPGQVTDAFTYLPMSSVLFAPARWLTGDVRWGLAVIVAASAVLLLVAAKRSSGGAGLWFAPACLLVLTPGHPLLMEMTWTEPLVLLLVVGTVLAAVTGRRWWPIALLALALASKQHVWLLLPLFAAWQPFGLRKAVHAALGAAVLCLPWIIADPRAMYDDTIGTHLTSDASERISTVHSLLARAGIELSLAVSAGVLLGTLVWCGFRMYLQASPAQLCFAAALVLLVANLMSKHAYFNQWWLCGSLLLTGVSFSRWEVGEPSGVRHGGDEAELVVDERPAETAGERE